MKFSQTLLFRLGGVACLVLATATPSMSPVRARATGLTGALSRSHPLSSRLQDHHLIQRARVPTLGVFGWGDSTHLTGLYHLAPLRVGTLTGVIELAAGDHHSLALKNDGTVWAWGDNNCGQLGPGADFQHGSSAPVQVPGLAGVGHIAAGASFSLALKNDGTVWAWGANNLGQLGAGSSLRFDCHATPARVANLDGVTAIAAGADHSVALKSGGTVWAWGSNGLGQLSKRTSYTCGFECSTTPIQIDGPNHQGLLTGIVAIAAGGGRSLALKGDHTVMGWGMYPSPLATGVNSSTLWPAPAPVAGLSGRGVTAIAAGPTHNLFLAADTSVWASGIATSSGSAVEYPSTLPRQVRGPNGVGILTGVTEIAAGAYHSLARRSDGTVWTWGHNDRGQLGTTPPNHIHGYTPVQVPGLSSVTAVAAGSDHSLIAGVGEVPVPAVEPTATPTYTETPLPTPTYTETPLPAPTATTPPMAAGRGLPIVSLGPTLQRGPTATETPGVRSIGTGGSVRVLPTQTGCVAVGGCPSPIPLAWGANTFGQLGDGTSTNQSSIAHQSVRGLGGVTNLAAGAGFSLALADDGTVWAWGLNDYWQLGAVTSSTCLFARANQGRACSTTPLQVLLPGNQGALREVRAIAAGDSFGLALKSDGTVWAWGINAYNQLGTTTAERCVNNAACSSGAVQVRTLTNITAIATHGDHSLALERDGTVWTWGRTFDDQSGPVRRVDGVSGVMALAAGGSFDLALKDDGTVWSWGRNDTGQLGANITCHRALLTQEGCSSTIPVQVHGAGGSGVLGDVSAIAAGTDFGVAVKTDGTAWAWGNNDQGQLGDNAVANRTAPVAVTGVADATAVSAGGAHTLLLTRGGGVWAWGANADGQLGVPGRDSCSSSCSRAPLPVRHVSAVTALAAGADHSLVLAGSVTQGDAAAQSGETRPHVAAPTSVAGTLANGSDTVVGQASTGPAATSTPDTTSSPGGGTGLAVWSSRASGTAADLSGVACASASACYAVGASGALLATSDGGTTWTDQSNGSVAHASLSSVACPPSTSGPVCVAVGPAGTIQTLTRAGRWPPAATGAPTDRDLYGVTCPAAGTCLAAGQAGTLLLTTTSGGAWVTQDSHTSRDLYGLACASPLLCVAVGENGTLLRGSADPAHPAAWTWTTLAVPTAVTLWSVSCTPAACAAVGGGGTLLVTTDLATWQSLASGTSNPLYAVSCASDATTCVATGFRGTIVGGALPSTAPWTLQLSGTVQGLNGVTCARLSAAAPCLAVGDGGTLLALSSPAAASGPPSVGPAMPTPLADTPPFSLTLSLSETTAPATTPPNLGNMDTAALSATMTPPSTATVDTPPTVIMCEAADLFIHAALLGQKRVISGNRSLGIVVHAMPDRTSTVTLQLRRVEAGDPLLFTTTAELPIGPTGRGALMLPVSFNPSHTLANARLIVTFHHRCRDVTRRLAVTIVRSNPLARPPAAPPADTATETTAASAPTQTPTETPTPTSTATETPTPTSTATETPKPASQCVLPVVLIRLPLAGKLEPQSRVLQRDAGVRVVVHTTPGGAVSITAVVEAGGAPLATGAVIKATADADGQRAEVIQLTALPVKLRRAVLAVSVQDECGTVTQRLPIIIVTPSRRR